MTHNFSTPLIKKLGFKEGQKIYLKNVPGEYFELLSPLPDKLTFLKRLSKDIDAIHLFSQSERELERSLKNYKLRIKDNGFIWVSWPKKSSKVKTDITENSIRDVALPMGLVDIKVCSINDIWSSLKLVIRKEYRK